MMTTPGSELIPSLEPTGLAVTSASSSLQLHKGELLGRRLTPREIEVLSTYARVGNLQSISDHLGIPKGSVKHRLTSIYAKLGVTSGMRTSAAILAFVAVGWLRVPPEEIAE